RRRARGHRDEPGLPPRRAGLARSGSVPLMPGTGPWSLAMARHASKGVFARAWRALRGTLIVAVAAWGALALWFQLPGPWLLRVLAIAPWCVLALLAIVRPARLRRRLPGVVFAVAFVAML